VPDVLKDPAGNWFPIYLEDGTRIGVSDTIKAVNTQATYVAPQSGVNVRATSAPASAFIRPVAFTDYSSQFYYYYQATGQTIGSYLTFPLSLYALRKDYPNPQDCNDLETTIVPGVYNVEFPTIQNPPYGKATMSVAHRMVPDGTLTIGTYHTPTWLIRSLTSAVSSGSAPVTQSWVNGRLTFDPYLPATINWDSLSEFATASDYITIRLEDDAGNGTTLGRQRANIASLSFDASTWMNLIPAYGTLKSRLGNAPLSVSGHIVMQFSRYANGQTSADLSTVTLRVPVQLTESYASWRQAWFPNTIGNASISGPAADPDGDGLTNQQEYEQGSNPLQAAIAINTPSVTDITNSTATLGATVENDPYAAVPVTVYERGVVYSPTAINSDPYLDDPGVLIIPDPAATAGAFAVPVTELDAGTQYSFKGYVITDTGIFYTTPATTFTTPILPTVTSPTSTNITTTTAVLGGTVTSGGDTTIIARGVVYSSTNPDPLLADSVATTTGTTGVFTVPVTGLALGTTYWFKAYATNSAGTSYTTEIGSFTTPATLPTLAARPSYANRTATTVILGGNVTSNGGSALTECGVVYSVTSANSSPLIGGWGVRTALASGTVSGVFTVPVTGLTPGTTYSFRAYATNSLGTAYSSLTASFFTYTTPTVTSPAVTNLTATTVTLGGTVTNNGGSALIERGVIYSTDPTMSAGITTAPAVGTAITLFTVPIVGLTPGTKYYFQAYARSSVGIGYSTPTATFTTAITTPIVTSPTHAYITDTTATLGGNVTSDGGSPITERGVVYSIYGDPVLGLADSKIASGTTGVFSVNITALQSGTQYYYRAYAKNGLGISYTTSSGTFTTSTSPTVTSPLSAGITSTVASMSGNITSDGGSPITARGVVYSPTLTNSNPIIGGAGVINLTSPGITTGQFWATTTAPLTPGTSYSFKAYATNAYGIKYTSVATLTTLNSPTVTSPTSTAITATTATLGGNVTSAGDAAITERGIVYSPTSSNADPLIGGASVLKVLVTGTTGVFTANVVGLTATTGYTFKAYAISGAGTSYSPLATFTTRIPPTVTMPTIANLAGTSATLGGNVSNTGDTAITERGVVYAPSSLNTDPLIGGTGVIKVVAAGITTGVFTADITGLTAITGYTFKAYAINGAGTSYSPLASFTTPTPPKVTTPSFANLLGTTATLGGNVTSDGGSPITERGVVYSVTSSNANPLIGGAGVIKVPATGGLGVFTANIAGLTATTGYTFKAYAINGAGTSYSPSLDFTTLTPPTVITPSTANLLGTSVTLGGNVTSAGDASITERGVVYSPTGSNANPLINGSGVAKVIVAGTTGIFTTNITGLTPAIGYTFKAYAINNSGTSYSPLATFTTPFPPIQPTVTAPTIANLLGTSATLGGNVTSMGNFAITERGIVYSLTSSNANPLIGDPGVTQVVAAGLTTGVFTADIAGLTATAGYTFKAYATNSAGTSYSPLASFTTRTPPTVTTPTLADLLATTATLGGNVTSAGDSVITERGVVYSPTSTVSSALINGPGVIKVPVTGTTGVFTANVVGLTVPTGYIFRAYAINSAGVGYSPLAGFTTPSPPTVTSPTLANLTGTTARLGGNVTSAGDFPITERGVVYSRSSLNTDPLIDGSGVIKVPVIGTTGVFTADIAGLVGLTNYTFKAYAINSAGTSYSPLAIFTAPVLPTVSGPTITNTNLLVTTATLGGNVTDDGGVTIIERGVVYSLTSDNPDPVMGGTGVIKVPVIGTTGAFTTNITGLTVLAGYTVKAYATNNVGTSYSSLATFTTPILPTVTTPTSANLGGTPGAATATLGGNVTSAGNFAITTRGVVYSRSADNPNPLIGGSGVTNVVVAGTTAGVFTANLTGLMTTTGYSFKAYATNSAGTSYSPLATFTTVSPPTVKDPTIDNLLKTSVTLGSNVSSDGGSAITERGVVYSLTSSNADPLIGGTGVTKVPVTGTTGVFTTDISGLTAATRYTFKAYAINRIGTSYSTPASFITNSTWPTLALPVFSNPAKVGSNVTSAGGVTGNFPILERGIIYSITADNSNPFIGGPGVVTVTDPGTLTTPPFPIGAFALNLPGLTPGVKYTFKAYAINTYGTGYSSPVEATPPSPPTVTTLTVADILATSATLGGKVVASTNAQEITERGVVYSLTSDNPDPLIGVAGVIQVPVPGTTGEFTVNVSVLTATANYSFKAYAISIAGTSYSPVATFTTRTPPTVTTPTLADLLATTATLGGNVTSAGDDVITERGVVYSPTSSNPNPLIGITGVSKVSVAGTIGVFTAGVTGLTVGTQYTFKAYATNSAGTSYSLPVTFINTPTVTTPSIANLKQGSVTLGGNVTSAGDATPITERGVVYSLTSDNPNPLLGDAGVTQVIVTGTTGVFTADITGLTANAGYTFKAYATNSIGTVYSPPVIFTTPASLSGLSLVHWVPALTRAPKLMSLSAAAATTPTAAVPTFSYEKAASEINDGRRYIIQVSTDVVHWTDAATLSEWLVVETPTPATITAQWNSTTQPPARVFFRVRVE